MRFMLIRRADADTEAGIMPSEELLAAMGSYNEELMKAGLIRGGEGLQPSSKGALVRFSKGVPQALDGPFAETKELIAGFTMIEVASKQEAIEWVKRWPALDADANAAIEFYGNALGAVERFRLPGQDGKKVMHAELEIAGGTIFLSDMGPPSEPAGVAIALGLENAKAVDVLAARLAAHGATLDFGPEDMFWGDRFAEITDPFGHRWMLTAPKD